MLFDLPTDIALIILTDWLFDLKWLVALDTAVAPSVRSEYLRLVSGASSLMLPSAIQINHSKVSKKMATWIGIRGIKLSALEVCASMLKRCEKMPAHCLSTVRKLKVFSFVPGDPDDELDLDIFQRLLMMLPRLEDVNMSELAPANAGYLTVLSASAVALKHVTLDDSLETCDDIAAFVSAFSPTLETVHFGRSRKIDSPSLSLIASNCKRIRKLMLLTELTGAKDFMSAFASKCFPLLESLGMFSFGPQITDEIALAMFKQHPLLTTCALPTCNISPITCASILCSGRNIVAFGVASLFFDVPNTDANAEQKHSEVSIEECETEDLYPSRIYVDFVLQLASNHYPIRHFGCCEGAMINDDLLVVASVLGTHLKSVCIGLNGTADDDRLVQQLTSLCPLLESLYLNSASAITDFSLAAIGKNCKLMTKLSFYHAMLITDIGVCQLLSKIGEQLTELHLFDCALSSLVSILALCSNLRVLRIQETGISTEDIQVYLVASPFNRLPMLETLHVDPDDFDVLMGLVLLAENNVIVAWRTILCK